jgi:hypothetical protein
VAHNDTVFNQQEWHRAKVEGTIWTGLTDYGRAAWHKLNKKKFKNVAVRTAAIDKFDAT